jgi:hypothetical protein
MLLNKKSQIKKQFISYPEFSKWKVIWLQKIQYIYPTRYNHGCSNLYDSFRKCFPKKTKRKRIFFWIGILLSNTKLIHFLWSTKLIRPFLANSFAIRMFPFIHAFATIVDKNKFYQKISSLIMRWKYMEYKFCPIKESFPRFSKLIEVQ